MLPGSPAGSEAEEIAHLLGSTPGTKKVQTIFEEATRIRSAEEIKEIELAWRKTEQPSFDQMPNGSVAQTLSMKGQTEGDAAGAQKMPMKQEGQTPSFGQDSESTGSKSEMAKGEPRKGGRPMKMGVEPESEKTKIRESISESVKRQKSL